MTKPTIWIFDFYGVLCHPPDGDPSEPYNRKVISWLEENNDLEIDSYIFTSGSVSSDARAEFAENLFTDIYYAHQLGWPKSQPSTYQRITDMLKTDPQKVFFVDDSEKNIKAAQSIGLYTLYFDSTSVLIEHLEDFI